MIQKLFKMLTIISQKIQNQSGNLTFLVKSLAVVFVLQISLFPKNQLKSMYFRRKQSHQEKFSQNTHTNSLLLTITPITSTIMVWPSKPPKHQQNGHTPKYAENWDCPTKHPIISDKCSNNTIKVPVTASDTLLVPISKTNINNQS